MLNGVAQVQFLLVLTLQKDAAEDGKKGEKEIFWKIFGHMSYKNTNFTNIVET
jgi:hypothetical protein